MTAAKTKKSKKKQSKKGAVRTKRPRLPTRTKAIDILKEKGADEKLLAHCRAVSALAVKIAKKSGTQVDMKLVEIGGLLHDLGRIKTHGVEHAYRGALLAEKIGMPEKLIRVIKRHIGAGLTEEDAERIGLPGMDYMPETIEEKIVAHADNLISGSKKVPVAESVARLVRMREMDGAKRMLSLHKELSDICGTDLDLL